MRLPPQSWLGWLLASVLACSAEELEALRARFTPTEPAIRLTYGAAYRVMGLELADVAVARVGVTVGRWQGADGASTQDVSLIDFTLDTLRPREEDEGRKIHVSLHNRIVAVLRRPRLDAMVFAKRADQHFQFLWHKRVLNNTEIYNMESGALQYFCRDYATGLVSTSLVGRAELEGEGKEVCRLLGLVYDAYRDTNTPLELTRDLPVHVYMRGNLMAYELHVKQRNSPVTVLGQRIPALRVWAYPTKQRFMLHYGCDAWTVSFPDLLAQTRPPGLVEIREEINDSIMIPLVADLSFPLGTIRGQLTGLALEPTLTGE